MRNTVRTVATLFEIIQIYYTKKQKNLEVKAPCTKFGGDGWHDRALPNDKNGKER